MSDGGNAMALYGVVVAGAEVAGATWGVTKVGESVTEGGEVGVMAVGEDVPLVVTAALARPVLEPPP